MKSSVQPTSFWSLISVPSHQSIIFPKFEVQIFSFSICFLFFSLPKFQVTSGSRGWEGTSLKIFHPRNKEFITKTCLLHIFKLVCSQYSQPQHGPSDITRPHLGLLWLILVHQELLGPPIWLAGSSSRAHLSWLAASPPWSPQALASGWLASPKGSPWWHGSCWSPQASFPWYGGLSSGHQASWSPRHPFHGSISSG